jgi:hypothetical protein
MKTALLGGTALCLAMAGCATTDKLKEPERLTPGTVAIAVARFDPAAKVMTYAERDYAQRESKAGAWATTGAKYGAAMPIGLTFHGALYLAPFLPVLVPIGLVTGAVVGAGAGAVANAWDAAWTPTVAREHAVPLHALLTHALLEQPPQEAVATRVVELTVGKHRYKFVAQSAAGPRAAAEAPDYRALKGQGFDAVLELAVTRVGLLATSEQDPSLALELDMRARVISLKADSVPWVQEWTHRSAQRTVVEWQAEDGLLVRNELDDAYRAVAKLAIDAAVSP